MEYSVLLIKGFILEAQHACNIFIFQRSAVGFIQLSGIEESTGLCLLELRYSHVAGPCQVMIHEGPHKSMLQIEPGGEEISSFRMRHTTLTRAFGLDHDALARIGRTLSSGPVKERELIPDLVIIGLPYSRKEYSFWRESAEMRSISAIPCPACSHGPLHGGWLYLGVTNALALTTLLAVITSRCRGFHRAAIRRKRHLPSFYRSHISSIPWNTSVPMRRWADGPRCISFLKITSVSGWIGYTGRVRSGTHQKRYLSGFSHCFSLVAITHCWPLWTHASSTFTQPGS